MSEKTSEKPPEKEASQGRRHRIHEQHKSERNNRFSSGIYGTVKSPVVPRGIVGIWEPPSYRSSRLTASHNATALNDGINRRLDFRCFYTGVVCDVPPVKPPVGWNHDPRTMPWLGTRDHLVPARRNIPGRPTVFMHHEPSIVWSSNVANVTLGLTPLPVRIRIRQWLMTTAIDRDDRSIEAGENMKWLIISMLDEFRIRGRYPWSRKTDGGWWYPEISEPFMARMLDLEGRFLALDAAGREAWISSMDWRF